MKATRSALRAYCSWLVTSTRVRPAISPRMHSLPGSREHVTKWSMRVRGCLWIGLQLKDVERSGCIRDLADNALPAREQGACMRADWRGFLWNAVVACGILPEKHSLPGMHVFDWNHEERTGCVWIPTWMHSTGHGEI